MHTGDMGYLIDSLFSLIPSISSIRQSHLLSLEARRAEADAESVFSAQNVTEAIPSSRGQGPLVSPQSYQMMLEQNIKLARDLGDALKNDEDFALKQHIPKVEIFSPVLQKETERLAEHRDAVRKASPHVKMDVEAQSQLHSALLTITKDLLASVEGSEALGPKAGVKETQNMDKSLKGLISMYQKTNDRLGTTIRVG